MSLQLHSPSEVLQEGFVLYSSLHLLSSQTLTQKNLNDLRDFPCSVAESRETELRPVTWEGGTRLLTPGGWLPGRKVGFFCNWKLRRDGRRPSLATQLRSKRASANSTESWAGRARLGPRLGSPLAPAAPPKARRSFPWKEPSPQTWAQLHPSVAPFSLPSLAAHRQARERGSSSQLGLS